MPAATSATAAGVIHASHRLSWKFTDASGCSDRRPGGREVLDATVDALVSRGIDALSVADIAAHAGVHQTSIYRRWGTKANLALDAVLSRADRQAPVPDTDILRDDLLALLHGIADFVRTPLGQALIHMAVRHDLPEYEGARHHYWAARFAHAAAILRRAQDRGELRTGVDHRIALEMLVAPMHQRLLLTEEPVDTQFLTAVIDHLLLGIAVTPPPTRPRTPRRRRQDNRTA